MTVIEFVDYDHTAQLVVTVGDRAALALAQRGEASEDGYLLSCGPGFRERWPLEALQHTIYASVVADVRDRDIYASLHEVVPYLRTRFVLPPLVALLVQPELDAEWTPARLAVLSRGLRAPVVRDGLGSAPSPRALATFVGETLVKHGIACFSSDDVGLALRPPCAGTVYRWDDVRTKGPDELHASLEREDVRSVLLCFRGNETLSLQSIDEVVADVVSRVRPEVEVVFAAPIDEKFPGDVLVAVMEGAAPVRCG